MIWRYILRPNLDDARTTVFAVREENAKIEVVGENHPTVSASPLHDFCVWSIAGTDPRPMNRVETMVGQKRLPLG